MIKFPTSFLKKRLARYALSALAVVVVIAACGAGTVSYFFHRAMPDYSGQATIASLQSPVSIMRDAYGVPHIFAENRADSLRALGYVHASERFFQMEMQRRAGQGRLSEVVGHDMLGTDKFIRTLGLYRLAQSSFAAMSPDAQGLFKAYSEGVNAWLDTHQNSLSPEFLLLHIKPEPWQPADSVVWGKLMAIQLSKNLALETLRAKLAATLPASRWQKLFPAWGDAPITTAPKRTRTGSIGTTDTIETAMAQLGAITTLDHGASNEWVVDGTRTTTGKPMLANDPHLGLEAPILWYLVRMVTPEGELRGATVPGLPVVLLGQNSHVAWGFTTTGSDVQDLFVETLDKNNANAYVTPKGSQPFQTRREIIHMKGEADQVLTVRSTRHGPVLSDIDSELMDIAGEGKVMALGFTGLGDSDTTAESLLQMNVAHDATSFLESLKLYQCPPQNIAYADDAGHIGYIAAGLVPVRKHADGWMPTDGSSSNGDWIGAIPFTQEPQIQNPSGGVLFNANNAVAPANYPYSLGGDWEEPYRAERLQQFFDENKKLALTDMAAMQADHLSLAARDLLPVLLRVKTNDARLQQAVAMLRAWDGTMDRDRPEPLIFDAWLYELNKQLFAIELGNDAHEKGPLKASIVLSLLSDTSGDWCAAPAKDEPPCNTVMADTLEKALARITLQHGNTMSTWQWGDEHRAILTHKIYSHIPLLRSLTDLSVRSSGDFYTLDRGGSFEMKEPHPFTRTHGGGFRGLYDLGDPTQSRFMITTGESGHVLSKHYGDLVPLWNAVQSITLTGSHDELIQHGAEELRLVAK